MQRFIPKIALNCLFKKYTSFNSLLSLYSQAAKQHTSLLCSRQEWPKLTKVSLTYFIGKKFVLSFSPYSIHLPLKNPYNKGNKKTPTKQKNSIFFPLKSLRQVNLGCLYLLSLVTTAVIWKSNLARIFSKWVLALCISWHIEAWRPLARG